MSRPACLVSLLVLAACGSRAAAPAPTANQQPASAPTALDQRAPADTRAMASLDVDSAAGQGLLEALGATDGCAPLPERGRLEVAVTERTTIIAELHAEITVADVACHLGGTLDEDGWLRVGAVAVEDLAEGVRLTSGIAEPTGQPWPLAERFAELAADHDLVLMASVGPSAAPIVVEGIADDVSQRWTVHFRDAATAAVAAAAISEVVGHAGTIDPALAALAPQLDGDALSVSLGADQLLDGLRGSLRSQVLEAFRVPSSSMLPTLEIGDHVYAIKGDLIGDLRRGDLVIYEAPGRPGSRFVKRVGAIGGDTVTVDEVGVTVNGVPQPLTAIAGRYRAHDFDDSDGSWIEVEGELLDEVLDGRSHRVLDVGAGGADPGTFTVPADHLFVLGDNRRNSADSRVYGAIPLDAVIAVPRLIWMSYGPDGVRWERILTPVQ